MELGLGGRSCIVTGASRGIGLETARRLCAEGAAVLLVARSEQPLRAAVERCAEDAPGEAAHFVCNVTDPDAGTRMISAAEERFGRVDVLVNNAGTARWRDVEDVPDEDWRQAWEVNVMACLRAIKAALPGMRERGWGRIVNVSSTAGENPSRHMP